MAYRKSVVKLRTKITVLMCLVVALALLTANFMVGERVEQNTERSLAEKATDISRIVARSAVVIEGLAGLRPASEIQSFAEDIRHVTNVEFIVVFDMNGIRKSHPDVTKIGLPFVGGDEGGRQRGRVIVVH